MRVPPDCGGPAVPQMLLPGWACVRRHNEAIASSAHASDAAAGGHALSFPASQQCMRREARRTAHSTWCMQDQNSLLGTSPFPRHPYRPAFIHSVTCTLLPSCRCSHYRPRLSTLASPRKASIGATLPLFSRLSLDLSSSTSAASLRLLSATRSAMSLVVAIACTPSAN